jgi:hypothetical protein
MKDEASFIVHRSSFIVPMRAALFFAVLAVVYCGAGLLPGRVFAPADLAADAGAWKGDLTSRVRVSNSLISDVLTQFMAWDAESVRLLRGGEMPWSNRWAGADGPLFANPQTALLSPFTWPRLLFGDVGWALCAMLRIFVAGMSMTWMARAMGASGRAAIFSGFVYATCGYGVLWLLYPIANLFAVLPALAAAALKRRYGLVALFAALSTIGGHPETLFCGVLGIAALLIWERRGGWRVALAALGGFLLCGVVLVPFALIVWASDARLARVAATPFGFRWNAIAGSILPGFLGSPLKGEIDLTALQTLPENFILRCEAFVGFIVLVAIALAWRRLPPIFRHGLIIGAAGFVIALRLPLLRLITKVIPLTIEYFTVVFVLFAAAAAGPALEALTEAKRTGKALLVAGLLLAAGAFVIALPPARPLLASAARSGIERLRARGVLHKPAEVYEERLNGYLAGASTTAMRRVLIPALCWAVAGIGLMRRRRELVICAAAIELLAFGLGFNPAVTPLRTIPPPIAELHRLDPTSEYYAASNIEVFPSNLGTLYRVRDVVSYDALESRARIESLAAADYDRVTHSFPLAPTPQQRAALATLGVRWLITPRGVEEIANASHPPATRNVPAAGIGWGVVASVVGLGLSIWSYRLSVVGCRRTREPITDNRQQLPRPHQGEQNHVADRG